MVFFALCLLAVSLWVGSFFTQVLLDLSHTGLEEYLQGYTLGVLLYPPSGASLLTEIYLCDACSDHQKYRRAALPRVRPCGREGRRSTHDQLAWPTPFLIGVFGAVETSVETRRLRRRLRPAPANVFW